MGRRDDESERSFRKRRVPIILRFALSALREVGADIGAVMVSLIATIIVALTGYYLSGLVAPPFAYAVGFGAVAGSAAAGLAIGFTFAMTLYRSQRTNRQLLRAALEQGESDLFSSIAADVEALLEEGGG